MTYPVLADLKTWVGTALSTDDTPLTKALNDAIETFERKTGRLFVAASSDRYFFVKRPYVTAPHVLNLFADLVSVTVILNADGTTIYNSTAAVEGTYFYLASETNAAPYYQVYLKQDQGKSWIPLYQTSRIKITGLWGFSTGCPDDVFTEIMVLAHYLYRNRSTGAGGAIVAASRSGQILEPANWPQSVQDCFDRYKRTRA